VAVSSKESVVGINQFWLKHRKRVMTTAIVLPCILWPIFFTLILVLNPKVDILMTAMAFLAGLSIHLIVQVTSAISSLKPLENILATLIHTNGELSALKPPNPNDDNLAGTGLDMAVNTVYNLALAAQPQENKQAENNSQFIIDALDQTSCGFAIINDQGLLSYASKSVPIEINTSGEQYLKLLFPDGESIQDWLQLESHDAIRAEKTWSRIPDKLPDQEDRRFFDVVASYQKGAAHETVVTLFDSTNTYKQQEQDLDFISFAAHELRGPITVIRGYIDVLADELHDSLQDDQHELFRRLEVSAGRLSSYVNNILNTAKYDRRHLKIRLTENSLKKIYDDIHDDMNLRATSQGRLLSVSIPDNLPTIAADQGSLSEVFSNIIDNAIKYSNTGGTVIVSAEQKGEFVEFHVQDRGVGMPGNVVSNLFQKFYRSHRSRETVAGTGIGLYISKAIVDSHGGSIRVSSEEGKGSIFTISLPVYATVAEKLKANNNSNEALIDEGRGWIKNHSMFKG
jgi:signal transduction histidine kinase